MNKKDKTLSVLNIIFSSILFIGTIYLIVFAIGLITEVYNYNPDSDSLESLGYALGLVVYMIGALVALIPFVISLVISIVAIKTGDEYKISKWCLVCDIIMIVIIALLLIFLCLYGSLKQVISFG